MDPKYRVIVENWNKFVNEEEQVEEGLFDSFKGLFGKGKKEPEEKEEPYDQEKSLAALEGESRRFNQIFALAAYLYFQMYEDAMHEIYRDPAAKDVFSKEIVRKRAIGIIPELGENPYKVEDWVRGYLGDTTRKIIIDFVKKNKLEQALDMPGFVDFLTAMREGDVMRKISTWLVHNFSDRDARNRSLSNRAERPFGTSISLD